jgi:hypothetical protein
MKPTSSIVHVSGSGTAAVNTLVVVNPAKMSLAIS